MRTINKLLLSLSAVASACIMMSGTPAHAVLELQNEYIKVGIGDATDIADVSGRFDIITTKGDPTTDADDWSHLLAVPGIPDGPSSPLWTSPFGLLNGWQVMVDSTDDTGSFIWPSYTDGITAAIWGDPNDGIYTKPTYKPITSDQTILSQWYPNSADAGLIPVRCDLDMKLMRDTVRFKWTLTNDDWATHLVGFRLFTCPMPTSLDNGSYNLENIAVVPGRPLIEAGTQLMGSEIPDYVETMNSVYDPVKSIRLTFNGNGATKPDVVGIDDWSATSSPFWTYGILPGGQDPYCNWLYEPITDQYIEDLAYGAFWKPIRLASGRSRTIVSYVGLGCATSSFANPSVDNSEYVAAVQGPRALKFYVDSSGEGQRDGNPFTVSAYVYNLEKYLDLEDVSFTLMLPEGLELDPYENGQFTKTITRIGADKEATVSWLVNALPNYSGIKKYSISVTNAPTGTTVVDRTINIPANQERQFSSGWQMVSVPFNTKDGDPVSALGLNPYIKGNIASKTTTTITDKTQKWVPNSLKGLVVRIKGSNAGGVYNIVGNTADTLTIAGSIPSGVKIGDSYEIHLIWKYDTASKAYKAAYDLQPGGAYWVKLGAAQNCTLANGRYAPVEWAGTRGMQIPLNLGWNLIGNPYVYGLTVGELRFYHRNYGMMTYDQALARGMISSSLFWWDPTFRKYENSTKRDAQLLPWQGYWMRALRSGVIMVITPEAQVGAAVSNFYSGSNNDTDYGDGSDDETPPSEPGSQTTVSPTVRPIAHKDATNVTSVSISSKSAQ